MVKNKDYLKTFCDISHAFGTTLNKEELLTMIIGSAVDTVDGKAACLFLADKEKDMFVPVAQSGLSDNYLHANPIKARSIVDEISKKGYLHFRDATSDARLEHHEVKKAEGIATILSLPVVVRKITIGILSLYFADTRDFTPDEIQFLSALADQGGVAIENARLFDRMRQNTKLFLEMSASINSTLNIKDILKDLTVEVSRTLGMKGAVIRLLNEDDETLSLVASHGLSSDFLEKGPVSAGKCLVHALKGETQVIGDVATDKHIQYRKETIEEGIAAMVCAPIKSKDTVIGVLRLYSATKREFSEPTLMLVNALAHQGGLAIQNASMFLALEKDKRDLEQEIWSHRQWF